MLRLPCDEAAISADRPPRTFRVRALGVRWTPVQRRPERRNASENFTSTTNSAKVVSLTMRRSAELCGPFCPSIYLRGRMRPQIPHSHSIRWKFPADHATRRRLTRISGAPLQKCAARFKWSRRESNPCPKTLPLSFYKLSLFFFIPSAAREQAPLRFQ